jgi:hypothetical protein
MTLRIEAIMRNKPLKIEELNLNFLPNCNNYFNYQKPTFVGLIFNDYHPPLAPPPPKPPPPKPPPKLPPPPESENGLENFPEGW